METNYGYYTGSLFVRELERLKEEYIQLDLDDMKVMMKEDILLLEKAMDILYKNKIYKIEETIQDVSEHQLIQLHFTTEIT
ncbi:hypothetical protein [Priestia aryabhattai]|uniref:hypothetical protein n=1 Tax=Priestia aryabhattai TaxID=412384 RepID=UPI002380B3A9|nr:hypothetical protein [Priestia aryabhattai]WDW10710.1 hypothetical protein PWC21_09140 [Priestia aryabhattai]